MAQATLTHAAGQFLKFAAVGGAGFLVDAGVLATLHNGGGLDPFTARAVSLVVAALTTWRLNRVVTFQPSSGSQALEGIRYAAVAALTAAINYAFYAGLLTVWPDISPIAALVGATLAAMTFSYAGYSRFAFRGGGGMGGGAEATSFGSPSSHRR